MKIILSPAKKMIVDTDNLAPVELPVYIDKTTEVLNWMKSKSKEELKAIWKCNDKIAEQNFNRLENMDLYNRLTPAVLAYEGIAFQYMAPSVFEIQQFEYLQNHLRILSAFYGILKPMDGVTPYRLEMQAKVGIGDAKNLYEYWGPGNLEKNRHKYLLQYHIIFVCKYRKKLLVSRQISDDIKQFSYEICQRYNVIIRHMETDKDHIHYMIETEPTMSVSKIVNLMKSYTTYHIWKKISPIFTKTILERTYLLDRWILRL